MDFIEYSLNAFAFSAFALGAILICLFIGWGISEIAWRTIRNIYSWPWLFRAIRHYSRIERPPFSKKDEGADQ